MKREMLAAEKRADLWVYRQLAFAHPVEAYDMDPKRFWEFFQEQRPGVSREEMEKLLNECRAAQAEKNT